MIQQLMEFELPGFRFHPTEEELLDFYLRNTVSGQETYLHDIIGFLNIYNHEPWDLPGLAKIGEREWYFFLHREGKIEHGGRPRRTTKKGYWKATGSERAIRCLADPRRFLGHRKTMVFYQGRAPQGCKTDWIMNEYRLPNNSYKPKEIVACKVYRKATSQKVLEERAVIARAPHMIKSSCPDLLLLQDNIVLDHKLEGRDREVEAVEKHNKVCFSSLMVEDGFIKESMIDLQLPKFSMDWTFDPFWLN